VTYTDYMDNRLPHAKQDKVREFLQFRKPVSGVVQREPKGHEHDSGHRRVKVSPESDG